MSAAFAPDGSKAVTASKDGTMRIWNLAVRYQLQVRRSGAWLWA
jgi:WD40 repeat protein